MLSAVLLVYALCGQYGGSAPEWKLSPYLFPALIALLMLVLSASLLWEGLRRQTEDNGDRPDLRRVLTVTVSAIIYCLLMPVVGFLLSTIVFLAGLLYYLGERRLWIIALTALSCTGLCHIIFDMILRVRLP